MSKDIKNYNSKEQLHGYQEWYWPDGKLRVRGNAKNGNWDGYRERYNYSDGKINELIFYIL